MEYICSNDSVKKNINSDIKKILNDFIDARNDISKEGTFVGKVLDNDDPEKLGRCKILVYSVFSESISAKDLPWAIPEFGFTGSLKGSFIVPEVGAFVRVTFENNEINLPKYSTKVLNRNQLPTNKDKNYPDNMIFFETDRGDSFELDRSTGDTIYTHSSKSVLSIDGAGLTKYEHKSGTTITIDVAGNVKIESVLNLETSHGLFLKDDGSVVVPEGQGPYCAVPTCPFGGFPHSGRMCAPGA